MYLILLQFGDWIQTHTLYFISRNEGENIHSFNILIGLPSLKINSNVIRHHAITYTKSQLLINYSYEAQKQINFTSDWCYFFSIVTLLLIIPVAFSKTYLQNVRLLLYVHAWVIIVSPKKELQKKLKTKPRVLNTLSCTVCINIWKGRTGGSWQG
jgi:hypothetical protein